MRMVFMGQFLTDELPFKEVFLHAMVRDAHGRKMSKSLGNVIDPLDVIYGITLAQLNKKLEDGNLDKKEIKIATEGQKKDYPQGIPECGTDALRFALMTYMSQSRDINLDVLRVQGYRFFCNKIWQGTRFVRGQIGTTFQPGEKFELSGEQSVIDKWILSRLSFCVQSCDEGFSGYNFQQVTTALYNFWLYELCDIYVEAVKPVLSKENEEQIDAVRQILYHCLETFLRLLAPFMPFITEELWQRLPHRPSMKALSICVAEYPEPANYPYRDEAVEKSIADGTEDQTYKGQLSHIKSQFGIKSKISNDIGTEEP